MTELHPLSARGIELGIAPIGGMLCDLAISDGGRTIRPLHKAPWVGSGEPVPTEAPPHLVRLEGDFFCAPFAGDVAGADTPAHGWPANGHWRLVAHDQRSNGTVARFRLDEKVHGATVEKQIALHDGSPVVYQTHTLSGGTGSIPVAHHAMIHAPRGAALSFSPKAFGATPARSLEEGSESRSLLAYPQRFTDLTSLRLADGTLVDASTYPFAEGHEDFLVLADRSDATLGWSAAVTPDFIFFAIKDARVLPQTTLWMSNGGRRYPPWNGRHRQVLGIEEACSFFAEGVAGSAGPNSMNAEGIPTAIALVPDGVVTVRYALGAVARTGGFSRIADIAVGEAAAVLIDVSGAERTLPFDFSFFDDR